MPTETVYDVLIRAQRLAAESSHAAVAASHLTLALLDCDAEDRARQLLNLCGIKRDEMRIYVEAALDAAPIERQTGAHPRPFSAVSALLREANHQAHATNEPENQNALLLIALVAQRSDNGKVLRSLGLEAGDLRFQLRNLTRADKTGGNPLKMLDADAQNALDSAHQIMRATGCGRISAAHLLLGILAHRKVYALISLADNGVDLDELVRLAQAQISSDGEIATAQIRLDKGAKRALERARDIVPSRWRRKPISPQALLWGLLPREVTLREKWKWGAIDEPLKRVWNAVDVVLIERVLCVLLGIEIADETQTLAVKPRQFHAGWVVAGMAWAYWLPLLGDEGWAPISGALAIAIAIRNLGIFRDKTAIHIGAGSFMVGCLACCLVLSIMMPWMKSP